MIFVANNSGVGVAMHPPDVVKQPIPAPPGFLPVPLVDISMNATAVPRSPNVSFGMLPAVNQASARPLTTGDEPGVMGGMITGGWKGPGKTLLGYFRVLINLLPGTNHLAPTAGNMMNAPLGVQTVPSICTVFFAYRTTVPLVPIEGDEPSAVETCASAQVNAELLRQLNAIARGETAHGSANATPTGLLPGNVAYVRIAQFNSQADLGVFNDLRRIGHENIAALILDLRGNPGGDVDAAFRLADDLLPRGTALLCERDHDGDEDEILARQPQSYSWPMCVLIDQESASAAELLAATLQYHGRATVMGQTSYGKATAQQLLRARDGSTHYQTVVQYKLPDGRAIEGRGVVPDIVLAPSAPTETTHGTCNAPERLGDPWIRAAHAALLPSERLA